MQGKASVRGWVLCGTAAVMVASSSPYPVVRGAIAAPVGDGTPSPEACAALGFATNRDEDARPWRSSAGAPAPLAAPPPPMSPPVQTTASNRPRSAENVGEIVVTAEKRQQSMQRAPIAISAYAGRQGAYPAGPPAGTEDTERYPHATSNPIKRVADDPVSTFSIDVDTASYANVRRFLEDGQLPPHDAVRVEELVNYFDYGYPRPQASDPPFRPFVAVTPAPWKPGDEILHVALQGYDKPDADLPPLNLTFLVDTSGSMESDDRLPLAQKALNVLIDQLRPQDHVSLVAYAGSAGAVLGPTGGEQKLKLRCAVDSLQSGGSTAGGEGLALAYSLEQQNFQKGAVNRIVLMTDGDFNVGIADPEKLKDFITEKRRSGIYLSVYGYGRGNYNDIMMQDLSQSGNGTAAYVDSLDEARRLFRDDFRAQLFPIADDVKIQVEFNPAQVREYRLIGYETRLLNREDFNNDKVDAGEVGAGASVTALYEITPANRPGSSDALRYQPASTAPTPVPSPELAFLKVRYKLPGEHASKLIDRPIGQADVFPTLEAAPESTRWALAVAGYGQRLRGDPWLGDRFGWGQIGDLADGARGADRDGLRAQFVQLVHDATGARSENE